MTKAEKAQAIDEKYVKAMNETDGPRSGLHVQWMMERDALDILDDQTRHEAAIICRQTGSIDRKIAKLNALFESRTQTPIKESTNGNG